MIDEKDLLQSQHQEQNSEDEQEEIFTPLQPTSRRDIRALGFHYVYAVDRNDYKASLDDVVAQFEKEFNVVVPDDSYAITLAQGAIDHRDELDTIFEPVLKNWDIGRIGCCTKLILRMGVWELRSTDKEAAVILNEAVELAKAFAEKDSFKFVNGVLDEVAQSLGRRTEEKSA